MNKALSIFGDALTAMGTDIAERAAAQAREEDESYERVRTLLSLAQSLGVGKEAHVAMYEPGEKMVARKTLWYRRQKRLFAQAIALGIPITSSINQKALAQEIFDRREALKTTEQKQEDALRMFQRTAKGALTANVDGGTMARTLLTQAGKDYKTH